MLQFIQEGKYFMPIRYKVNIIAALKEAGYSTYKLRKEKLLGEATLQKFRNEELVSWDNIATVCQLLCCQPGDLMEYIPEQPHPQEGV
jgi:putative transcriptional regulator